jgi:hypothetical protein
VSFTQSSLYFIKLKLFYQSVRSDGGAECQKSQSGNGMVLALDYEGEQLQPAVNQEEHEQTMDVPKSEDDVGCGFLWCVDPYYFVRVSPFLSLPPVCFTF